MTIDRTKQPPIILANKVSMPETRTTTVTNGIRLTSIKAGTQDVIRLSIVFRAGTIYQKQSFAASAMLNMLSEGSVNYSSAEMANALDFYGIYYETNIDRDYSMITVSCLNRFLDKTLELLEQILLYPTFDPAELAIYATKRKQSVRMEREKPSFIAREEFSKALFGPEHPYGTTSDEALYDNLTSISLKEHYTTYYTAANCFVVTSGMVGDIEIAKIVQFLVKIPNGTEPAKLTLPAPLSSPGEHIERSGASQSCIRMGKILFTNDHPDYNAMQVVSTILGGYFGSRLVSNLREDKGYTYGIYSAQATLEQSGYFAIATDVAAEHRLEAIAQIKNEIERLRTELVPEEELSMVRNTIVGELMRLIDGPFGIADITIESLQCNKDNKMVNDFLEEVRTITPKRVNEVAQQYLDPESMITISVG